MNQLFINTDGGSRGNPGPAAIGVVFCDQDEKVIFDYKKCIGVATNNEAEYSAIVCALQILAKSKWMEENNSSENSLICRLDSQLVVEQLNGNYKIKQDHIKVFVEEIKNILLGFKFKVEFMHIPREQNKLADKLVNEALDSQIKS